MAKNGQAKKWINYPEPDAHRGGCKVSWNYYRDEKKARKCAEVARHNAVIALSEGFDFGYCSPGSVEKVPEGVTHNGKDVGGMYEVCLP